MEPEAAHPSQPAGLDPAARRRRGWALGGLTLANCALMALLVSPGGPTLVSILSPVAGEVFGVEGVRVVVRVPDDGRADPRTLRAFLNGADITYQLVTGQNGAAGQLHGVLDGENVLRIEVEAASWWFDGRPFAASREVRFFTRRPLGLDRG